jgi:hypothetical protein
MQLQLPLDPIKPVPFTPATLNYAHVMYVAVYKVRSSRITFGTITCVDQYSIIGIATCYSLDGPRIESWWGYEYLHLSRPVLGPTQPAVQWVPGLFPSPRQPGDGVDHPPPSGMEVKERVELYLYFSSGPLWPILG